MNAESIVVSLDMAKKLKDAGMPAVEGLFRWVISEGLSQLSCDYIVVPNDDQYSYDSTDLPAFTAEEILRRLPLQVDGMKNQFWKREDEEEPWIVGYAGEKEWFNQSADTLANAAAACYCYLAEQKLLPAA